MAETLRPGGDRAPLRRCDCGCGEWARPGSKYFDYERCRSRAYKARVKAEAAAHGFPETMSLSAVEAATRPTPTRSRSGYGENGRSGREAARKTRRPDLRIAYRKAVDAVGAYILSTDQWGLGSEDACRSEAERILKPLLPPSVRSAA